MEGMAISLTESAANRVKTFLSSRGHGVGLRLGVRKTGCSGFAYVINYADEAPPGDLMFEDRGVKVFVDPSSITLIDGTVVDFVKQLHRQLGRRLILVWDRWSVHRSAARQLAGYDWLQVEYLPAYAPELNPVEQVWNHTKYGDLANFIPANRDDLRRSIVDSLNQQRSDAQSKYSCFRYTQLI